MFTFSNHNFTLSYKKALQFYETVNMWVEEQMTNAPAGLKGGWLVSNGLNFLLFFITIFMLKKKKPQILGTS